MTSTKFVTVDGAVSIRSGLSVTGIEFASTVVKRSSKIGIGVAKAWQ
tara:strand:- start:1226 stop:1366 length:141 start_codon:yes stop_codon:yes gene_type:complete